MADVDRGPGRPGDVLVEPLAGPEAEHEPAAAQHAHGGGLLGHDHGVVAEGGAGDHRDQIDPGRRLGQRPQDRPGVAGVAVAVAVEPGVDVVGDGEEVEPGLLRLHRLLDQLPRRLGLAHQAVAGAVHGASPNPGGGQ